MARFEAELPEEILKDIKNIYDNYDEIFGGMTKAGAKVAEANVRANLPISLKNSNFEGCIKLTRVYKTPSDGGINTKVIISGYFLNHNLEKTPAPLVANVFEYGRSWRPTNPQKQPFFRKSFKKKQIEQAMLSEQKKLSGGLLNE